MTPIDHPEDLFRAEKARSVSERGSTLAQLLAEAKAAFDKMMAEGAAARKSGRPRKNPLPPPKLMAVVEPVPVPAAKKSVVKKSTAQKPAKKKATATTKKAAPKKHTAKASQAPKKQGRCQEGQNQAR